MDQSQVPPYMMNTPTAMAQSQVPPYMMNTPTAMAQPEPEVINVSAPKFKLVLPFASFDRSTPTKFAGSILNMAALLACLLLVFLMGKFGVTSGKTISVFIVCMIFTIATTALLSTSGYKRR